MSEDEINKIIGKDQELLLLLGYAMGAIFNFEKLIEKEKYDWLLEAVNNVVYLDKPIPPKPKGN
jgi:hypothetical protein